jgi:uncharacterized protein YyaL (SSP411 family)
MTHASGAFYSAEDADSPDPENPTHKGEGAFYIWRKAEIDALLPPDVSAAFCRHYGVQPDGNVVEDPQGEFTGRNILFEAEPESSEHLKEAKRILFEARSKRPRPHLDDKILTSWNALMISAFAKAAQVLDDEGYLESARRAMRFLLDTMYSSDTGLLLRRFREGEAAIEGFLDDYAFLAQALLDLYEADFEPEHLEIATRLARDGFARFEDSQNGGFYSTASDGEPLLWRIKDDYDGAEPAGNSVAVDVLLRLAHLTGNDTFRAQAEKALRYFAPKLREQAGQAPQMLVALGRYLGEPSQYVLRCAEVDAKVRSLLAEWRRDFQPYRTYAVITDEAVEKLREVAPFLAGLERKGMITTYQCANFVCQLPQVVE